MQLPPGYGYLQVKFWCTGDPEPMLVGLGCKLTSTDEAALQTLADNAEDAFAGFGQSMTNEYQCRGSILRVGTDGGEPRVFEGNGSSQWTGQQNAGVAPPNVAYLVRKATSKGGRRNRGRMYIPGVPRTWFSPAGVFGNTELANIQTSVDAVMGFANAPGSGVDDWVVLHSTGISSLPAPTVITGMTISNKIATQRRRLRP